MAKYHVTVAVEGDTSLEDIISTDGISEIISIDEPAEKSKKSERNHSFEVGNYGLDKNEPTPSPEANTVKVVELTDTPANEYKTSEGKLVSEYQNNRYYDSESLVVGIKYPNMGKPSQVWYMPEARIDPA